MIGWWRKTNFEHAPGCSANHLGYGWATKPQMAALFGVSVAQFDGRYRRYALEHITHSPEGERYAPEETMVRTDANGRLLFVAKDVVDVADGDGAFEKRRGPRLRSYVCPDCGVTIGAIERPPAPAPIFPTINSPILEACK